MSNVLEQWEVTEAELIANGIRFSSVSGPTLEAHERYWVVLTTPEESNRYGWWVGLEVVTGAAKAERYSFQVGDKPPGTWIGTDGAFAPGLKVVGVAP
jgi:hypothetical protein